MNIPLAINIFLWFFCLIGAYHVWYKPHAEAKRLRQSWRTEP